jgi:hypothetical protein
LNQQPTRVIHNAELYEEQPLNYAKKQEASAAESTCSEEPVSELPVAGSSGSEVHATDTYPVPTCIPPASLATKRRRAKQHSEILTSTPMKAVFIKAKTKKLVHKKEGKPHERKARKLTQGVKRKGKQSKLASKKTCKRNNSFESSEDEMIEEEPCDDDSSDDADPLDTIACLVCGEFGMDNELWYRYVHCSRWTHSECSGWDTPKNYKCDFCFLKNE